MTNQPTMSTRYWIQRAQQALHRGSTRMAELYMKQGILASQDPRNHAEVEVK